VICGPHVAGVTDRLPGCLLHSKYQRFCLMIAFDAKRL
jgi:hypothetical protein